MTKTIIISIVLAMILILPVMSMTIDFSVDAEKSKGTAAKQYGSATKNKVCGDRLCSEPQKEKSQEKKQEEVKTEKKSEEQQKAVESMQEQQKSQQMAALPPWQTATGTIVSEQDPGMGHETHQLAIIMPPNERVYNGVLTYSASEPIQLVALHGPLLPGQDMGQPTWSPDGKTKFALTFIDPETNMGSWTFSGNAIAVHTMKPDQFTVSYSVVAGS